MFDIQRQAFLGTVQPNEIGRLAFDGLIVIAREVTDFRPLDFDHPRAEVGELTGAKRCGDGLFEGDDGDVG